MLRWRRWRESAIVRLAEDITRGQRVAPYRVMSGDSVLSRGTTIGYTKIDQITPTDVLSIRLVIDDAVTEPERVQPILLVSHLMRRAPQFRREQLRRD
jgi:hypothetical protein